MSSGREKEQAATRAHTTANSYLATLNCRSWCAANPTILDKWSAARKLPTKPGS